MAPLDRTAHEGAKDRDKGPVNVLDVREENGRVGLFVDHELAVAGEQPVGSGIPVPGQTLSCDDISEFGFHLWRRPSWHPERQCHRGARA